MEKSININDSVYNNLIINGINQAKDKNFDKSEEIFIKAINTDKSKSDAYINLSNIFLLQFNEDKALSSLESFPNHYNQNINILNHYWKICMNYKHKKRLLNHLKKLETERTNQFKNLYYLLFLLGKYYRQNEEYVKGLSYFKRSINNNKKYIDSYVEIFDILEKTNKIIELQKLIEKYKKLNIQTNPKIQLFESLLLNRNGFFKESQNILDDNNLKDILSKDSYYYIKVLNLASKNNEKLGYYKKSLSSIKERNKFIKNIEDNKNDIKENMPETVKNYKEIYTKKNIEKIHESKSDCKDFNLAFLVGFPRSGTTLLDTILRSHSKIHVLEEKPYILNTREKYFSANKNNLKSILNINNDEKIFLRNYYLNQINTNNFNKNKLVVDKLPLTITELGFVNILFPKAKIIVALRHPCDVTISCFFTSFKPNKAMNYFLDLNDTIDFYNNVFDLFEHYEENLNMDLIKIKYEDVVFDFKKEIVRLLDFFNLSFENNLNKFYNTAKKRSKISTPSYSQVVNPLYSSSIGRWKKYNDFINIERNLNKWIAKFNY